MLLVLHPCLLIILEFAKLYFYTPKKKKSNTTTAWGHDATAGHLTKSNRQESLCTLWALLLCSRWSWTRMRSCKHSGTVWKLKKSNINCGLSQCKTGKTPERCLKMCTGGLLRELLMLQKQIWQRTRQTDTSNDTVRDKKLAHGQTATKQACILLHREAAGLVSDGHTRIGFFVVAAAFYHASQWGNGKFRSLLNLCKANSSSGCKNQGLGQYT